jgi:flagellar basal-body rod protein FlgF
MGSLYTGLSGAMVLEQRLQAISNDLANLNTPAHKRQRLAVASDFPAFNPFIIQASDPDGLEIAPPAASQGDMIMAHIDRAEIDFSQGALRTTGQTTDLALEGPGFFVVQVDGEEMYTRAGAFELDTAGALVARVNGETAPVLGESGPINIGTLRFEVFTDGTVQTSDGAVLGTVRVVDFDDPQQLERAGNSLYRNADGTAGLTEVATNERAVKQGALELSNADPIRSLVAMIEVQRAYEAVAKAMSTIDETTGRRISLATR